MIETPILETERLILRGPRAKDEAAYVAFFRSARASHVGGGAEKSAFEGWQAWATEVAHWVMRGYGMWALTEKGGDDSALGYVGCWYPGGWNEREIGWVLWPEAEGRGYAFEAAQAARAYAYRTLGWPTAISNIEPDNVRSIRLAERLGCVLDPDAAKVDPGDLVYRHPDPEMI